MPSKKFTKSEACAALARHIWPNASLTVCGSIPPQVCLRDAWFLFDPFTNYKNALAVLDWVRFLADSEVRGRFEQVLITSVLKPPLSIEDSFWAGVHATDVQIVLAVCEAVGIRLEDDEDETETGTAEER